MNILLNSVCSPYGPKVCHQWYWTILPIYVGALLSFTAFASDHFEKLSMHTIKFLNPSTSGKVHKSIPICFITSFGTEILFSSGLIFLKIFPCCWQLLQILTYYLMSSIMPCQKNRSENFWYVDSRPQWAAKALAIELSPIPSCTSCIILVLLYTSNTTLCFSLYMKSPLKMLKFLHAFLKLDLFPLSFKIPFG